MEGYCSRPFQANSDLFSRRRKDCIPPSRRSRARPRRKDRPLPYDEGRTATAEPFSALSIFGLLKRPFDRGTIESSRGGHERERVRGTLPSPPTVVTPNICGNEGPELEATPAPTHLRRRSHRYRPDDHLQGRVLPRGSFYEQPWSHRSSSGPKMRTVFTGVQSCSLRGAGERC